MKQLFQSKMFRCAGVVLSFYFLVQGDPCAGQEVVETAQVAEKVPFQPVLKGPTQEEADLKKAEYLFIQGRVLEAEKRGRQALQRYERACQYASSDTILVCLVSLALQQKRYDEALRYFDKISNPSLLGIETLDELSTKCARLGESDRVVMIYRAILKTIPLNDSGPLRMLVHDRLGWSEYEAENFDAALISLNAVRMMLKNPARYGVDEESLTFFEGSEELNLCLLLDIYIAQKQAEKAREILAEWKAYKEKSFEKSELSEEELRVKREECEQQFLFESARIAYVEEDAEKALELVMKAYEAGYEETPYYVLLETILETLGHGDELVGKLEELAKKLPKMVAPRKRLLMEYLKRARDTETVEERTEVRNRIEIVLQQLEEIEGKLNRELSDCIHLIFACWDENMAEFIKLADGVILESESSDCILDVWDFVSNVDERIISETNNKVEEIKKTSEADGVGESNEENRGEVEEEAEEDRNGWFPNAEAREFAVKVVDFVLKEYIETKKTGGPWRGIWLASVLAEELGRTEDARVLSMAVLEMLEKAGVQKDKWSDSEWIVAEKFIMDWGVRLAEAEELECAEEFFRRGKVLLSKSVQMKVAYVRVLLNQGALEAAEKEIQKLRQEEPENLEYTLLEAAYLQQNRKYDDACVVLYAILEELADNYSAEINREYVQMIRQQISTLEEQRGNMDAAEELLRTALDEFPDDVSVKNSLAYFWACNNQNLQRALRYSRESLKTDPESGAYLDTLGWIYYRLGELEQALEYLNQAVEKIMDDPVLFSHLGDVYAALGQKEKAVESFQKSIKEFQELQKKSQSFNPKDWEHAVKQLESLKKEG
ncbi:MAG: tetratricopeptide repeat protein [Planctomycetia bacterium]|nr:tetratricopeptide repeat protein [Planctomycetia bacterium]